MAPANGGSTLAKNRMNPGNVVTALGTYCCEFHEQWCATNGTWHECESSWDLTGSIVTG